MIKTTAAKTVQLHLTWGHSDWGEKTGHSVRLQWVVFARARATFRGGWPKALLW